MFALAVVANDYDMISSDYRAARRVPAWLMSVGLHTCLLVACALLIRSPVKGPRVETDRSAGIALVQRSEAETSYFTEEDLDATATVTATSATDSSSQPTSLPETSIEFAVQLPSSNELSSGAGLGQVLPGAIGFTTGGEGARGTIGGQARTQVFGAEGTGNKFIYVFDRSASMEGFQGRPMAAAKQQLTASLNDLESVHQFQIVFYNDETTVFHPDRSRAPSILFASDENKKLAVEFVDRMTAIGGTRHVEALVLALGMSPDVIFFLTDAAEPQLTPSELAEIRRRNRSEATINSIEFGSGPRPRGENFLMRLARENHGKHVYVDVSKLP
ncbi:MAG: hypothetical protein H6822_07050 [Planctomycetaceae bacterium]|nr:hypothetical protein [Planctomycetales bacterium]MCB9921919.1 hypothetical protein [Planctomycetaceae bacterium]